MTVKLSRKQERLYHEAKKAQDKDHYDKYPRITREYILNKYPTDQDANKRLRYGYVEDYDEYYKEKKIADAEHDFPGITQYGCSDPFKDYDKSSYSTCTSCPRNSECKRDLERIYNELDNFGRSDRVYEYRKKRSLHQKIKRSKPQSFYGLNTNIGTKAGNMLQSVYRVKTTSTKPKRKVTKRTSK